MFEQSCMCSECVPESQGEDYPTDQERIAALEAELAEAKRVTFDPAVLEEMNRLEAENAELRKDAERYRWLRENKPTYDGAPFIARNFGASFSQWTDEHADAAIDAAMKEAQS